MYMPPGSLNPEFPYKEHSVWKSSLLRVDYFNWDGLYGMEVKDSRKILQLHGIYAVDMEPAN